MAPITQGRSAHTFHIPVMGTGFTIDTPVQVARYGISSVVSLVDDVLIEQMRKYHAERAGEDFVAIPDDADDARARRITEYLNLLDRIVARQSRELQASPFEPGSEITRYFEMLPECSLKDRYRSMLAISDSAARASAEDELRPLAVPGTIDVNIMTKVDRDIYREGEKLPPEHSDAMSALRGFARSTVSSSIVLSAGMNMRLYTYAGEFPDFLPDEHGVLRKKVVLKVSDFRSALIQGKFLAKRGVWVSEYRIESGLNCGGHAFATTGYLMGPILSELRAKREELVGATYKVLAGALQEQGRDVPSAPPEVRITVQGGIGTAAENELLLTYYKVDGTGWGTPFLLVPEATRLDDEHIRKLLDARKDGTVFLSNSSPFGIPFWNLRNSASEDLRRSRIAEGTPGSPCPRGYLKLNSDYSQFPLCMASRSYIRRRLEDLESQDLPREQFEVLKDDALAKSCICHDLAGGATRKLGIDPKAAPAICTGPNIVNFSRIATLEEMVSHIYGRINLMTNPQRPHMFIREMMLYVDYFRDEFQRCSLRLSSRTPKYFEEFRQNLLAGIEHYHGVADRLIDEHKGRFLDDLKRLRQEIESLPPLHAAGA